MGEKILVRPIELGDIAEMNKLFEAGGLNDGEYIFRLIFETTDCSHWIVAVNEKREIIGAERGVKLVFDDVSVIFALRLAIRPDYRGNRIMNKMRELWGNTPSSGSANARLIVKSSGLKKFTMKIQAYIGRPKMEDLDGLFPRKEPLGITVGPLHNEDTERLVAYDRTIFDYDRSKFIREYCRESRIGEPYSKTIVAKSKLDGAILGFGNLREFEGLWKILPLYAESATIAEELLKALTKLYVEQDTQDPLRVFFDASNRTMVEYCKRTSMEHEYATVRAYTGGHPDASLVENYIKKESVYVYQSYWPA